jgi:GNAT superfamily N-acetyltransferase
MQNQKFEASYTIRDMRPEDRNFIFATWLRGLYYGDSYFERIQKPIFMENYHKVIERILNFPDTKVWVACLADEPDVILGYSVSRNKNFGNQSVGVLDWVFVKSAWRKIGIGRKLLPMNTKAYTHTTNVAGEIIKSKELNFIFNPFI